MKNILFPFLILIALGQVVRAEIEFQHGDWREILSNASKENKLVFVDAYTSWCGPCKWMAANTFTDADVSTFFNAHFVNAKIDMENGEGLEIAKKYHVYAYPTLLFVNATGELVHAAIGALDAATFLELGKKILDPAFPSMQAMKQRFASGETDRKFLADYILVLKEAGENFDEPLARFKPGMAGDALLEENNWKIFVPVFRRNDSEEAKFFLAHLKEFGIKYGAEDVNQKALNLYSTPMVNSTYKGGTTEEYNDGKAILLKSGVKGAKYQALVLDLEWYKRQDDWGNFAKTACAFVKQTPTISSNELNNLAWSFYEGVTNSKQLKSALDWAMRACKTDASYPNLDTKAMVLYKLGRNDEAIATVKSAIEKAKETGENYSVTETALQKMLAQ